MKVPVKRVKPMAETLLEDFVAAHPKPIQVTATQVVPSRRKNSHNHPPMTNASAIPDPRIVDGQTGSSGKRMLTRIKEVLAMKATKVDEHGVPLGETRLDTAAIAYVEQMESGSFIHTNAIIEREEGKIGASTGNTPQIKMYINMPTEGDDAP